MITKDDLIAAALGILVSLAVLAGILYANPDVRYDTEQPE